MRMLLACLLAALPLAGAEAAEKWRVFATPDGAVAYDALRGPAGGDGGPVLITGLDWKTQPQMLQSGPLGHAMVTLAVDCAAGTAAIVEILSYSPGGNFLEATRAASGALSPVAEEGPAAILFRAACGQPLGEPMFEAPTMGSVLRELDGLLRR